LGIRPWEWRLMTVAETDHVLDWLDEYQQRQEETEARLKKN
jgi:hypothetical protein